MSEPLAPEDFPGPKDLPILGNVRAIDLAQPIESLMSLAREYGPIFKLTTPGGISVVVSGVDLVSEICDDARFDKVITAGLSILAEGPVDAGLFTAETDDPMWARAHGILMAPFSMQAMRDYMPAMIDIADQLMGKWDRLNPGEEIDVPADMTRLTLDTIALCGFGYRFNSFYRETPHPFVQAMVRVLDESQARLRQLPIQTRLKISAQRQFEEDQAFMAGLVDDLIREAPSHGRCRGQHGPARPHDHWSRQTDRTDPAGREHPRPVHHVLDRRPRDDQWTAVVRHLLPARAPGIPRPSA